MFDLNRIAQLFRRKREGRPKLGPREVLRGSRCRSLRVGFNTAGGYRQLRFSKAVVVGSDPSCDLRIGDSHLLGRHAEIYRLGTRWWIRDLGSSDGMYLNGEIVDAAPVDDRAVVRLGTVGPRIWLDVENPKPAPATGSVFAEAAG